LRSSRKVPGSDALRSAALFLDAADGSLNVAGVHAFNRYTLESLMLLMLSLALAGEPATTAPATATTTTATATAAPAAEAAATAPAADAAAAAAPAAAECATVTVNADGTSTLSDPALPPCGPDGKPVPKKKKLEKSNNGRMEAEETRE